MVTSTFGLCLTLLLVGSASIVHTAAPSNASLVIFTYESIFQYGPTPLNIFKQFANVSGINVSQIQVVYALDSNEILSKANAALTSQTLPLPDVLFGLDNVLQQETAKSLLIQYNSSNINFLRPALVSALNLSSSAFMMPFDYSFISLVANSQQLSTKYPAAFSRLNSSTFSFSELVNDASSLLPLIVIENPLISGPGLNFFMWTIAVFGDRTLGYPGMLGSGSDWRPLWSLIAKYSRVVPDWDMAFNLFSNNTYPVMVSYATDPSYDYCSYGATNYFNIFSNDDGVKRGWKNIEGIGITKYAQQNATHLDLAKKFVDFILGQNIQNEVAENQWMFPARANVTLPTCFTAMHAPIDMPAVTTLTPSIVHAHIADWLNEVQAILAGTAPTSVPTTPPATSTPTPSFAVSFTHNGSWGTVSVLFLQWMIFMVVRAF